MAEEDTDYEDTRTAEASVPSRPSKPSTNKESIAQLDYKVRKNDDILEELNQQSERQEAAQKDLSSKINDIINLLQKQGKQPTNNTATGGPFLPINPS